MEIYSVKRGEDTCLSVFSNGVSKPSPIKSIEGSFVSLKRVGRTTANGVIYQLQIEESSGTIVALSYILHTEFKQTGLGKYHKTFKKLKKDASLKFNFSLTAKSRCVNIAVYIIYVGAGELAIRWDSEEFPDKELKQYEDFTAVELRELAVRLLAMASDKDAQTIASGCA